MNTNSRRSFKTLIEIHKKCYINFLKFINKELILLEFFSTVYLLHIYFNNMLRLKILKQKSMNNVGFNDCNINGNSLKSIVTYKKISYFCQRKEFYITDILPFP